MSKKKNKNKNKQAKPEAKKAPVYLDQDGNPIPFFEPKENTEEQKRGYKFGLFSFLGLTAAIILITSLTPFYPALMIFTPPWIQEKVLWPLYRNIPLYAQTTKFDEPLKIPIPEPGTLPILSYDTGICFSFLSTQSNPNPDFLDEKRLNGAAHGKRIAEIIAVDTKDKYEYQLKEVTYSETTDDDRRTMSVICQKFGHTYASVPENIGTLYIRPLKPFTAEKVVWNSVKHLYDDYAAPIDPIQKPKE